MNAKDIQGIARDPISYEQAVDFLVAVIATSNYQDSSVEVDWLRKGDADDPYGLFGKAADALEHIVGEEFMEHLWETGEVDMNLANRRKG